MNGERRRPPRPRSSRHLLILGSIAPAYFGTPCAYAAECILRATMNQSVRSVFGGTCVLLLLLALPAFGQISTAQLSGKVTDTSNAVLPGATVTVTQTDTGAVRNVVTDADGSYLVSNLSPGPYRLEVALQGFRTYVQTGI